MCSDSFVSIIYLVISFKSYLESYESLFNGLNFPYDYGGKYFICLHVCATFVVGQWIFIGKIYLYI